MQKFFLWVGLFLLVASGANAASYQMNDGTIVDPIQYWYGSAHSYSGPNLEPNADLPNAILTNADLTNADLSYAILTGANLLNADLSYTDLTGADLSGADLPNAILTNADLTGADLSYARLGGANLLNADLSYADLTGADLWEAHLNDANLISANLTGAYLSDADLSGADLSYADLTGAILRRTLYLGQSTGSAYYNAETDFTNALSGWFGSPQFDPVAAGWTLIPEPNTALLLGIGMMGLGMRRRQRTRRGC